jgi:hypothetical protein
VSPYPQQQLDSHPAGLTKDQLDDLESNFSIWQPLVNGCCVVTGLIILFGTRDILVWAHYALASSDGVQGLHIYYQQAIWWFFPGIGAVSLSFEIVLQIWSIFAGRKVVGLYSDWAARQPKKNRGGGVSYYDTRKWCRWIALLVALPAGMLSLLALRMHTTFAEDGMHEYGYAFAAPGVYTYPEIIRVTQVDGVLGKHNAFIPRPFDVIDFANGHHWSQHDWDDTTEGITDKLDATLLAHTKLPFFRLRNL